MGIIRAILILIVVAVIVGFSAYNAGEEVTVDLIRGTYVVPMVVVVYWSFLAGMVVAALLAGSYVLKAQTDRRLERRDRRRLELEVGALRNRTIEELEEL